ncbi:GxxExxY protein [Flavobacterium sp. LS2P90]|uniref:GxxExxY protein n=1 Tax=Flavobacterium xylosi TaxID=3230415 RepID=A0ABW6HX53_9FLAO
MGKGLLESVYHQCMKEELSHRKINFFTEMKVPIFYKKQRINNRFSM